MMMTKKITKKVADVHVHTAVFKSQCGPDWVLCSD